MCLCACVCRGGCEGQRRPLSGVSSLSCSSRGLPMSLLLYSLCSRLAGLQSWDCFWYAPSLYHKGAGIRMWVLDILLRLSDLYDKHFYLFISLPYAFLTSSTVIWRGSHLRSHPLTSSCSLLNPDIPKVLHFSHQEHVDCFLWQYLRKQLFKEHLTTTEVQWLQSMYDFKC